MGRSARGLTLWFDAAHLSGMVAGRAWASPLAEGAQVMTMSTCKSLGGPPGGLVVGNDASLFERIDAIAYPGLTANVDAGRVAALALSLLDWTVHGPDHALAMQATARRLEAARLPACGIGLPLSRVPAASGDVNGLRRPEDRAAPRGGDRPGALRAGLIASGYLTWIWFRYSSSAMMRERT